MVKKYINIYKYKLSLSGRDDTRQGKSLIFIVAPQVEQKKKLDVIITYNNSNYQLT